MEDRRPGEDVDDELTLLRPPWAYTLSDEKSVTEARCSPPHEEVRASGAGSRPCGWQQAVRTWAEWRLLLGLGRRSKAGDADVKPTNTFLLGLGDGLSVRLDDLSNVDEVRSQTSVKLGSPRTMVSYRSPELLEGQTEATGEDCLPADLLGCVSYLV